MRCNPRRAGEPRGDTALVLWDAFETIVLPRRVTRKVWKRAMVDTRQTSARERDPQRIRQTFSAARRQQQAGAEAGSAADRVE